MAPPSKTQDETPLKKLKDGILSKEQKHIFDFDSNKDKSTVSITVVGASGDLAKKKIFPALFALYYEGCLPEVCPVFIQFCGVYCLDVNLDTVK